MHPMKQSCSLKSSVSPTTNLVHSINVFAEIYSENSNLNELSRSNFTLHNIFVIPKEVRTVITVRDSSKASSPDCIPEAFRRTVSLIYQHILADFFNLCLKDFLSKELGSLVFGPYV